MNQKEEYNRHRIFTCNELNITKNQYNYIRRVAKKINQMDCNSCNGDIDNRLYDKLFLTTYSALEDYIKKINKDLYIYHQSDPRGASLYLAKHRIDGETYHHAQCIY
jgi:hypothetical protein